MNHDEIWENLNQELWDRRTEMTEMKIAIAKLRNERDEARREAYRQWLMRQCDAEHEYGTHDEYRRLAEIYKTVFKEYPLSSMFESSDPPPYELPIGTEGVQ